MYDVIDALDSFIIGTRHCIIGYNDGCNPIEVGLSRPRVLSLSNSAWLRTAVRTVYPSSNN